MFLDLYIIACSVFAIVWIEMFLVSDGSWCFLFMLCERQTPSAISPVTRHHTLSRILRSKSLSRNLVPLDNKLELK